MKVVTVIGARPQFIKASVVSDALRESGVDEAIIHTGQHFDSNMSDIFFTELSIPRPFINLGIGGGTHGQNTGRMIEQIETHLKKLSPDLMVVYGDTDSTLAGALAASKLHIPVAHVEAGLRSHNRMMPEEVNRILTDHISDILFPPTQIGFQNLKNEGLDDRQIHLVGDVMYDAARRFAHDADGVANVLRKFDLRDSGFVLLTIHRASNVEPNVLTKVLEALGALSEEVIWPIHPRPAGIIRRERLQVPKNIVLIDPVGYRDMLALQSRALVVVTDSGGVQKEAFFNRVPCVTLRSETEWTELIAAGWNRLVPEVSQSTLLDAISLAKTSSPADVDLYGGGVAATLIAENLGGL